MAILAEQDPFAALTHHDPEAQRISDAIDDALKAEKKKRDKRDKGVVRVLLLGQSESGKSTTLKNLRLAYDPEEWTRERASWRSVVQLNIIRSVHALLDDSVDSLLKLRLAPLRRVEADLKRRFGASALEAAPDTPQSELAVRAMSGLPACSDDTAAQCILAACLPDIRTLYNSSRSLRIEESSGFFLNDLDRVCAREYLPSDDDVVRARLRTTGVQEWRIRFNGSQPLGMHPDFGRDWVIYDVGGCRTARHAWLPFFENINAIIFLAPLSPFDLPLLEEPSMNRLDDTMRIWRFIVASPLLSRTTLIVFLNKCDLLKRKLRSNIQFGRFVTSYTGENELGPVVKWMRDKFKELARVHTPSGATRATYLYPTSVTDTKATAITLRTVHDGILRDHLKSAEFM